MTSQRRGALNKPVRAPYEQRETRNQRNNRQYHNSVTLIMGTVYMVLPRL